MGSKKGKPKKAEFPWQYGVAYSLGNLPSDRHRPERVRFLWYCDGSGTDLPGGKDWARTCLRDQPPTPKSVERKLVRRRLGPTELVD